MHLVVVGTVDHASLAACLFADFAEEGRGLLVMGTETD